MPTVMTKYPKFLIAIFLFPLTLHLNAEVFELVDGSKVVGERVNTDSADKIVIKNKIFGTITLDAEQVVGSSVRSGAESHAAGKHGAEMPKEAPTVTKKPESEHNSNFGQGKVGNLEHDHLDSPAWSGQLEVDFEYASAVAPSAGAGRVLEYDIKGMLVRKTPHFAFSLFGEYNFSEVQGAGKQSDNWLLGTDLRKDLGENTFFYGQTNYIIDEIVGTRPQWESLAGIGFEVIKNDRTTLTLVPGLAYTDVNYIDTVTTSRSISEYGYAGYVEFSHLLTEKTAFKMSALFVQSLEDTANYYYKGSVGFETALFKNVSLQTNLNFYYNDTLDSPFAKSRETLTTGLKVRF